MCFWPMKILGTVRWEDISARADCRAWPSSRNPCQTPASLQRGRATQRTDLVQLDDLVLCSHFTEELLCGAAVRTVGLAEHGDRVVVDDLLGFFLGGGHGAGRQAP